MGNFAGALSSMACGQLNYKRSLYKIVPNRIILVFSIQTIFVARLYNTSISCCYSAKNGDSRKKQVIVYLQKLKLCIQFIT